MSLIKEKLELEMAEAEFAAQQALSGFPSFIKWILVFGLIALVPSYFITKQLSFKYWQTKYKAQNIVAKPSFTQSQNLQVTQPQIVAYPDGSFGAIVSLTNLNKDLSISHLNYKWEFLNSSGQKILALNSEAQSGSTFVLPATKKYIIAPKILTSEPISSASITFPEKIAWQKRLSYPKVLMRTTPAHTALQTDPLIFSADSTVYNNSTYQLKTVTLNFIVKDAYGNLLALSKRSENDLAPYEKRAFKQLWPGLSFSQVLVEVTAETDITDNTNLRVKNSQSNSSDLSRPDLQNSSGF